MSLRDHFLPEAEASTIAARLQAAGAVKCDHGWSPSCPLCGVRCDVERLEDRVWWEGGVRHVETVLEKRGPWRVIPWAERVAWAERVDALIRRDEEKKRD